MQTVYLVTGAAGHLGNTVVRKLLQQGQKVRALVLPQEQNREALKGAEIYEGDVRKPENLIPFFSPKEGCENIVIHCAGIVSIASRYKQVIYDVNVGGTRNVVAGCKANGVKKLVYISSVHAIPELPKGQVMQEISCFDPEKVVGVYAKTKAEATQLVLQAGQEGIDVSVVHPSGICGPYDYGHGHITQLFKDYYRGTLTAAVNGGYDFCDVRDVANGVISCANQGEPGACYILSGAYYTIAQLLECFHKVTGKKRVSTILPMWFAKLTAPLSEAYYKFLRQPPLYTPYSLYTLTSNAAFCNEKAKSALGYTVRPMEQTVVDMMEWMKQEKMILR